MQHQDRPLKDRDLVSRLLDLSNELLIKGDPVNAFTCTQAAARLLALPHLRTAVNHPSGQTSGDAPDWVDQIITSYLDSYREDDQ